MPPYTKSHDRGGDRWGIRDGSDGVIALVDTERLADILLWALLNPERVPALPDYPADRPLGKAEEKEE
jgi:hypothetical protein